MLSVKLIFTITNSNIINENKKYIVRFSYKEKLGYLSNGILDFNFETYTIDIYKSNDNTFKITIDNFPTELVGAEGEPTVTDLVLYEEEIQFINEKYLPNTIASKKYVDEHDDHLLYLLNGGLPLKLNVTQEELESIINLTDNTYTILSSISPDLIKSVANGDDWYSTLILNNDFAFSIKGTGSIISSITCIESSNSINMQYTNSVYRAYNDLPFIDVSDSALCVITLSDGVESVAFAKGTPKRYNMATKKYVDDSIATVNADTIDNLHIWTGTQAQYDALGTKDSNTIYLIKEG